LQGVAVRLLAGPKRAMVSEYTDRVFHRQATP